MLTTRLHPVAKRYDTCLTIPIQLIRENIPVASREIVPQSTASTRNHRTVARNERLKVEPSD